MLRAASTLPSDAPRSVRPSRIGGFLATLAWLAACSASDGAGGDATAMYESPRYGFSIEYPDTLDLREYDADHVAIGQASGEALEAVAEVALETGEGDRFEDFAVERARQACAADGPDLSLQCAEVEVLQPVTAAGGAEGIVFYLRHLATRPGTSEVVEAGGRGPFFAFDLSPREEGGAHRALFIRAPVILTPAEAEAELIRRIALSLRLEASRGGMGGAGAGPTAGRASGLAAVVDAVLLALGIVFQLLLAAGLPLGHAAWGGRYRVLPPKLRWGSLAGALILGIATRVLLARAGLAAPGPGSPPVRVATWIFSGFFVLNTLGNLASKSRTERYVMTPITVLLAACFLVVALS